MSPRIAIIIPTVNRADLLSECVASLLRQKDMFSSLMIVDNGRQGLQFDDSKIFLHEPERNLGVAASWNLGIRSHFTDPAVTHVMALNDDIVLGDDQMDAIRKCVSGNSGYWMYVGCFEWSVWILSREGAEAMEYQRGKYFDEKFYPAYFEDNDFKYRITSIAPSRFLDGLSELTPEIRRSSMSIRKDPALNARFESNRAYYEEKWGGRPGRESILPVSPRRLAAPAVSAAGVRAAAGLNRIPDGAPARIPCFIIVYNQYSLLKPLVARLMQCPRIEVILIDNASTEPGLLAYLDSVPCRVIRLESNLGHRAGWEAGIVGSIADGYYLYSDPDLDLTGVPDDFLDVMIRGHETHNTDCVGLSLRIDDLPATAQGMEYQRHEQQFWTKPTGDGFYRAAVDTTLALYHSRKSPSGHRSGLRTDKPYCARHLPWYFTKGSPPPQDYLYYLATCNQSASWAGSVLASCRLGGDDLRTRTDIINAAVRWRGCRSYLEIGSGNPKDNFDMIDCARKVSVDPDEQCRSFVSFCCTSDEFFSGTSERFDLIFIDGFHDPFQVARDISNALRILNPGGVIVLHDALPSTEWLQRPASDVKMGEAWTGGVWKAVLQAFDRLECQRFIVNTDYGCAVINTGAPGEKGDGGIGQIDELDYRRDFRLLQKYTVSRSQAAVLMKAALLRGSSLRLDIDPWSSHFPVLLAAVGATSGNVLEIGCGKYSTLMLHSLCRGRRLVTLETDPGWFAKLERLASARHEMHFAGSYDEFDALIRDTPWDVVLIDHAPAERRNEELRKVAHARYVVVHDADSPEYNYCLTFPAFRNILWSRTVSPATVLLSNYSLDDIEMATPELWQPRTEKR